MNDRFKFRVFLKYNQIMCDIDSYCFLQELNKCVFHFTNGGQKTLKNDDFILMQCTGLKDKNGTLIYEGDILKQPDGIIDYVYWSDGCYIHNGTAITNYDICYQGDTWAKEVNTHEVIGNIYENKELLED